VQAGAATTAGSFRPEVHDGDSVADELAARFKPKAAERAVPKETPSKNTLGGLAGRVNMPGGSMKALSSAGGMAGAAMAGPMRMLLPLAALMSKPLANRPAIRDTLGWVASVTLFTSGSLWMYYLGFHEPPKLQAKSTPAGLDDGTGEHAAGGHGESAGGHGAANAHGASASHVSSSRVKYAVSAFKPEEKEAKGGAKKPEAKKGGGGGGH
jgi:hypothetical protein